MAWESFSRIDLEALATPQIWERGQAYYQEGHLPKGLSVRAGLGGTLGRTGGDYWPNYGLMVRSYIGNVTVPTLVSANTWWLWV